MNKIVILGGGYAGMIGAMRLNGRLKGRDDVEITLVNGADVFVERIRLHQRASGQLLKRHSLPEMLRGTQVKFMQAWIEAIHAEDRTVEIMCEGKTEQLPYDMLIYALGSHLDRDSVQGVREYAYTLDATSAEELYGALPAIAARHGELVVVGGGLTGIEAATEFAERYPTLQVRIVTAGKVGAGLSEKGRAYLLKTFKRLGIVLQENSPISKIDAGQVALNDGRAVPFSACLWAGSFSVPQIAQQAGLQVNAKGRIMIDPYLRSVSHPEIYAVGDAAEFVTEPGAPIRMACATAMPMGAHGADNISALVRGKPQTPFGFQYVIQCISLGRGAGLVQLVRGNDHPRERVITGVAGKAIKELICRITILGIKLEKRFTGSYSWFGQPKPEKSAQTTEARELTTHEQPYRNL
ncbi:MAG: FAD-dependent oxidoreductase [Aggregatilineales bacterium]